MIMIGSLFATPGTGSPLASPVVLGRRMLPVAVVTAAGGVASGAGSGGVLLLDKGQLPLVSEDALRAEDHDQHERDTHEDEAERAGLHRRDGQDARVRQRRQDV